MNMFNFLVVDKGSEMSLQDGALYAVLAIAMVFAILLIIIGITSLVFKLTGLFELKAQLDAAKKQETVSNNAVSPVASNVPVEITDDDMMAAVLVATIDYRNEIKKDVKVVSIKEIK